MSLGVPLHDALHEKQAPHSLAGPVPYSFTLERATGLSTLILGENSELGKIVVKSLQGAIDDPHQNVAQSFRVIFRPCGSISGAAPKFHWIVVIAGFQIIVIAGAHASCAPLLFPDVKVHDSVSFESHLGNVGQIQECASRT
jgi:hypothetical protein